MSSSSHKILKVTAALITAVCASAQASEVTELEEVVVTASRTEEAVSDTLAPVTVITREQIEHSQASSVTELLKQAPGVQVTTNGGAGSAPGIYLRGTKTAQTLVLVDGQKINSPSSGTPPLQYLDPAEIERIEIVRGPRSSLYGADAIGGVIQIFTRQGEGKPSLSVRLGGGNMNTDEYGISFGGEVGSTRFRLGGNVYSTDGYDFTVIEMNGDHDSDAYENGTFNGSVSSRFSEKLEVGANFLYSEGRSEYDNNYDGHLDDPAQPYTDFTVINSGAFTNFTINDAWSGRFEVGYAEERADRKEEDFSTGDVSDGSRSTTQRYSASLKNDIEWQEFHLLTMGVDFSDETYEGSTTYLIDSRYNAGVFAQNRTEVGNQELQLAVRTDNNEAYGYHTTGSANYGLYLREDMRFTASFGTAFRAPTLGDLYYPGSGNPNLKPETSQNIEAGLDGSIRWADWSLMLYQNEMDNMIAFDGSKSINIDEAMLRGVEMTLNSSISDWNINTAVSFLNPENRSGKHSGNVLVYRAKQLLSVDVDRQLGRLGLGTTFRAQGKSYKDAENTIEVAGFGTVDLRASYKVTSDLRVGAKIVNLLDKEYMTVDGYREEPLSVFATLEWKVL